MQISPEILAERNFFQRKRAAGIKSCGHAEFPTCDMWNSLDREPETQCLMLNFSRM